MGESGAVSGQDLGFKTGRNKPPALPPKPHEIAQRKAEAAAHAASNKAIHAAEFPEIKEMNPRIEALYDFILAHAPSPKPVLNKVMNPEEGIFAAMDGVTEVQSIGLDHSYLEIKAPAGTSFVDFEGSFRSFASASGFNDERKIQILSNKNDTLYAVCFEDVNGEKRRKPAED